MNSPKTTLRTRTVDRPASGVLRALLPGCLVWLFATQDAVAQRARLQIINGSEQAAEVHWLKPDGERERRVTVEPGKKRSITTTLGHRFAIVGSQDGAERMFTSEALVQGARFDPPDPDGIPAFYTQRESAEGFPVVASASVNPYALKEAAYLVNLMLAQRPDVRKAMIQSGARLCILAWNEFTTDQPEWKWMAGGRGTGTAGVSSRDYWDARARGMGGSETDPFCSCAEENLLCYPGDPYPTESILIHEFAHNIHLRGMSNVDPDFDGRVKAAYDIAMQAGLWKGKYASVNHHEYFAEGVQSWFDDNRENDHDHNHVNTRTELQEYDPRLAALCHEVFGETELRYTRPATRLVDHLAGYDPSRAPRFVWPERLEKAHERIQAEALDRDRKANESPAKASVPRQEPAVPDFTRGDQPSAAHDWTLGPTGARGWIYTANGHSRDARQVLVTAVAPGSPAEGVLESGDVILGVNDGLFSGDARVQLARAIAAAEAEEGGGTLRLARWRNGARDNVELRLPVLGRYGATAPYDCPKSARILESGCAALAERMAQPGYARGVNPIPRSLNALALLASGNQSYLPLVKREAEWAAGFSTDSFVSWYYGYQLMLLAEYVMVTGDQSVLPGLTRMALETARGQSAVGTWGHRFSPNGVNLMGYGAMNQPGLSLTIGMVLAREAGVQDPELDEAIERAAAFLRWYVNKGAIPYGDHQPFYAHEDHGKCAAAAVLFDLLGDREAAEFFARMTTAAYSERERGHTGNYFHLVWEVQGVARCGPLATGAYLQEQGWYHDLARGWDGEFLYQGSPVGEEEHGKYAGWDCSGSFLLACALPLRKLRLTGSKPFAVPPLNADQTAEVIAAGRDFSFKGDANLYEARPTEQLLDGLSSWSPFVRGRSAAALGKRAGDFVPALLELMAGENRDARYGAIEALGALGPRADAAAVRLRAALQDPDPWTQCLAAKALPELGQQARRESVSDLLALVVSQNPADPRRQAARFASFSLFSPYPGSRVPRSILAESLEGVDRDQLIPALQSLLEHEDSVPRGAVRKTFPHLTDADLVALLPQIVKAIEHPAPSNEMFGDGIRLAGLDLLSRLHIREGMALGVALIEPDRWGERDRTKNCLASLARYGAHAQAWLPQIREARTYLETVKKVPADRLAEMDQLIQAIESSTESPTLVSLEQFEGRTGRPR